MKTRLKHITWNLIGHIKDKPRQQPGFDKQTKSKDMEKSESIKNIAKAIMTFHLKVGKINKDATNPFLKNKYASLSNILDAIQIPLAEAGLTFVQFPTGDNGLTTTLMHAESGEYMMARYDMAPVKNDPQGRGSVITYQRRYALGAVLGLNIEDDDDGNSGSKGYDNRRTDSELPWLNEGTPEYEGAVKKLKAGTTTIEKIKSVMRVSKAVEEKLKKAIK